MPRRGKKANDSADDQSLCSAIDSTRIDVMNELKNISATLNTLQSKLFQVESTLQRVLETQSTQDKEIKNLKQDISRIKDNYEDILDEFENRDRRKTNLIISGLPEREDMNADERKQLDLSTVNSLFSALDGFTNDVVSGVHRIGMINPSRPRLLKVICVDTESKRRILSKSKNLRNMQQYKNIYVNPDLTPLQQAQNKQLREELHRRRSQGENVMIRRGKVVQKTSDQNFH